MSSGFVSGGTIDQPAERDDEWRRAQQEIEETHKQRARANAESGNGSKSLYEVLQANKTAKQDAIEEATRLKNQYRALDADEAEFLDSVLEATRRREAAVEQETQDQLNAFRQKQEMEAAYAEMDFRTTVANANANEKASAPNIPNASFDIAQNSSGRPNNGSNPSGSDVGAAEGGWLVKGRKRKKATDDLLSGVKFKLRKASDSGTSHDIESTEPNRIDSTASLPSAIGAVADVPVCSVIITPQLPTTITTQCTTSTTISTTTISPIIEDTGYVASGTGLALNLGYASSDEGE